MTVEIDYQCSYFTFDFPWLRSLHPRVSVMVYNFHLNENAEFFSKQLTTLKSEDTSIERPVKRIWPFNGQNLVYKLTSGHLIPSTKINHILASEGKSAQPLYFCTLTSLISLSSAVCLQLAAASCLSNSLILGHEKPYHAHAHVGPKTTLPVTRSWGSSTKMQAHFVPKMEASFPKYISRP